MKNSHSVQLQTPIVGVAADHGGFELKNYIVTVLHNAGYEVIDFGSHKLIPGDDFPDYVIPLAEAVASGVVYRGIAVCGSGVGANIVANKLTGVRAGLISDIYSAHQGVEHDDMNLMCLGGKVVGNALAADLVIAFLSAKLDMSPKYQRRLRKIEEFETTHLKAYSHV